MITHWQRGDICDCTAWSTTTRSIWPHTGTCRCLSALTTLSPDSLCTSHTYLNTCQPDDLRRQTVDLYTSTGRVHFQTMSATLTSEPVTLENSITIIWTWYEYRVICDKFHIFKIGPCIPEIDEKMPPKVVIWCRCDFDRWLFDLKT